MPEALAHPSLSLLAFALEALVNTFLSPLTLGNFEDRDYATPHGIPRASPGV